MEVYLFCHISGGINERTKTITKIYNGIVVCKGSFTVIEEGGNYGSL